jgi:hypothetical protein
MVQHIAATIDSVRTTGPESSGGAPGSSARVSSTKIATKIADERVPKTGREQKGSFHVIDETLGGMLRGGFGFERRRDGAGDGVFYGCVRLRELRFYHRIRRPLDWTQQRWNWSDPGC